MAVTLWQDRFLEKGTLYKSHDSDIPGEWRSRPGFVDLIENLKHAVNHTDGKLDVIVAIPKDAMARPRAILECFPHPTLKMRVAELDAEAGTFCLERSI